MSFAGPRERIPSAVFGPRFIRFPVPAAQTTRDVFYSPATCAARVMIARPSRRLERVPLTSFDEFGLAAPILRALAEEKYAVPTPIQAQTIPAALTGRDIIGIAQTGTGKTAAFALPILHRLANQPTRTGRKQCRVLVLSPTRELSSQILDSFKAYGRHLRIADAPLSTALAIGGVSMGRQVRALLHGVDALVATPGRLLDLVQSNALRLEGVEFLVLDEADRMLDMGFIHDIRKIVAKLPKSRQTLFFSATMPKAIAELAQQMLRDPAEVAVTPVASTAERITQRIIHLERAAKTSTLADLLRREPIDRALVFTRTKHGADKVVRLLAKSGITAQAIHGNKSQNQRERVLTAFRDGELRVLIATDIAARGIDVDGISHVVNFDLPNVPETYVHRIGRTARAGAEGVAISLCDAEEVPFLRDIERLIRITIPAEGQPHWRDHANDKGKAKAQEGRRAHSHGNGRHNGHAPVRGRGHGKAPHTASPPQRASEGRHGHTASDGRAHHNGINRTGSSAQSARPRYGEQSGGHHHRRSEQNAAHRHREGIGAVAFMRRSVPARRDDAQQ
jgi:ATP-dependent RNA helicase RhlE